MATSKSVETLNNKVDQLIAAFGAQTSDIRKLQSENESLRNEIVELRKNRTEEMTKSVSSGNKVLNERIERLMKEVDKCMELLEDNGR